jgi:hypothetical protein
VTCCCSNPISKGWEIGKTQVKLFSIEKSVKAGFGTHVISDFGVMDQEE